MAAKKTTKKAAKKSYPSAKKTTVPKLRFATMEEVVAIIEKTNANMERNHAKTEAALERLSESQAQTEASLRMLSADIRKTSAENRKTSAEVQKTSAEVRELSRNIGRVGKDLGELMEFIVIPKIRLAMNAAGKHSFTDMQTDRIFRTIDELGEKKPLTEVDVLLYGDTEIMAVETKSHLMIRDVKDHIERLEKLRRHEDLAGIKDKKLVGAVVGAVVDKDVKFFALERGLCVVTIREEEDKLDVAEPETCRIW